MYYKDIELGKIYYAIVADFDIIGVNIRYVFPEYFEPAYCGVLFEGGHGEIIEVECKNIFKTKKEALKELLARLDADIKANKALVRSMEMQKDYLESANFQMRFMGETLNGVF